MGGADPIDSMALVEICVQLEDLAALIGFDFDWTSSKALSKSGSVFKSVGTLTEEFLRQMNEHAE